MLDALFGFISKDLAIDLGTANTLVYLREKASSPMSPLSSPFIRTSEGPRGS